MKSPEQARAEFDEALDLLVVQLLLMRMALREMFWRLVPHRHAYTTRQWCNRCGRSDYERRSK